uniref:NADH dehydrogenase subunit 5 n=1 Tax=Asemonea sichuanensis TaxID=426804 RepID=UPI001FB04464|nr:NADH dehydrogenase subunit 5 [Asemonea sichuanensis]ULX45817.1 NADH dehydrogenase subunit 5 [Asemonea sichuanensis]
MIYIMMLMFSLITMIYSMMMIMNNKFIIIKMSIMNLMTFNLSIDMMLDWISILFMTIVLLISSMIIMYSMYYIPKNQQKYFIILLLMFVLSMMILILSNNMFLLLLGWDGLGMSSYILVIYYQNYLTASCGSITILTNRLGDILMLLSMSMLLISSNWMLSMNKNMSLITMTLLVLAACSKSAQFPFSAWLPMAMAAPTPISALVHSSTLVTAGVYLMIRLSSTIHYSSMIILMIISTATALYSSMSANWEQDLKKIIALSTLSQIAMMMFAISLNSIMLAYLHLIIHAIFKSTMFLCAGIMIHESSYQDMRMMGMNFKNNPITMNIMGLTSMALMGIPFMSGFFSKDAIIEMMIVSKMNLIMSFMMIMSIGMTASYSLRMSFSSTKSLIKSNTLLFNHTNMSCLFPLMLLAPLAIMSGSFMTWILNSEQMFMMSQEQKFIILLSLSLGLMLGSLLSFKNSKYMKIGLKSMLMWFIHPLSTIILMMKPIMNIFSKNDNQWQEMYGPTNSFLLLKLSSKFPEMYKYYLMLTLVMMMMIPIIIMT